MQRDDVRALEQIVEFDFANTQAFGALLGQKRIVRLYPQAYPHGFVRDNRTDVARADDAEQLARQFGAHEF